MGAIIFIIQNEKTASTKIWTWSDFLRINASIILKDILFTVLVPFCTAMINNISFISKAPTAKEHPDFLFSVPFVLIIGSQSQISVLHTLGCLWSWSTYKFLNRGCFTFFIFSFYWRGAYQFTHTKLSQFQKQIFHNSEDSSLTIFYKAHSRKHFSNFMLEEFEIKNYLPFDTEFPFSAVTELDNGLDDWVPWLFAFLSCVSDPGSDVFGSSLLLKFRLVSAPDRNRKNYCQLPFN